MQVEPDQNSNNREPSSQRNPPSPKLFSPRKIGLFAGLVLPVAGALSQPPAEKQVTEAPDSALQERAIEPIITEKIPANGDFFSAPQVVRFVTDIGVRLGSVSPEEESSLVQPSSWKLGPEGMTKLWDEKLILALTPEQREELEALPLEDRLKSFIDGVFIKIVSEAPSEGLPILQEHPEVERPEVALIYLANLATFAAEALGDTSPLSANSLALISLGDISPEQTRALLSYLEVISQTRGPAAEAAKATLYEIGMTIPDSELARTAFDVISSRAGVMAELIAIRDSVNRYEEVLNGPIDSFAKVLLAENKLLHKSYEEQVKALTERLDNQERELWNLKAENAYKQYYEEEVLQPLEDYVRRRENPMCYVEQAAWGKAVGDRNVDVIPVGAKLEGLKIYYQAPGAITGIRVLYELDGQRGQTPIRGGSHNGASETFLLNNDEHFYGFEVEQGSRSQGPIGFIRLKSREVEGSKEDIVYYEINTVQLSAPWKKACDQGKSDCELAVAGVPDVAIGIVTYNNGTLQAFSFVMQERGFVNSFPISEEEFKKVWLRENGPEHLK